MFVVMSMGYPRAASARARWSNRAVAARIRAVALRDGNPVDQGSRAPASVAAVCAQQFAVAPLRWPSRRRRDTRERVRPTLGDLLLEERLIDAQTLRIARRNARRDGVGLCRTLVEERHITDTALADLVARRLKLPRVDLEREPIDEDAVREVGMELAEARRLLPLSVDRTTQPRTIRVAMADPLDLDALDEIELSTGCDVVPVVAPVGALADAIARAYRGVITKMIPRRPSSFDTGEHRTQPIARMVPAHVNLERTQPNHQIADEADTEVRLEALVELLVERGVVERDAVDAAIRRVLRRRAGE
jgi:hypothetical protein